MTWMNILFVSNEFPMLKFKQKLIATNTNVMSNKPRCKIFPKIRFARPCIGMFPYNRSTTSHLYHIEAFPPL